LKWG